MENREFSEKKGFLLHKTLFHTNKCPNETTFTLSFRVYEEVPAISTLREVHWADFSGIKRVNSFRK